MKSRLLALLFIVALGLANISAVSAQYGYGRPSTRLTIGAQGRVTPGLRNVIREHPIQGAYSAIIGQIHPATAFSSSMVRSATTA